MNSNDLSNKKLVEMFMSLILKKHNIDMKTELTRDEKQEIKAMIKDFHNQLNSFLEKKNKLYRGNEASPQKLVKESSVKRKQIFIDKNDLTTVKVFTTKIKIDGR